MKNINFHRQESVIRGLSETSKKNKVKKPINWDRIVYIVLLFTALFFIAKYFYTKFALIEANGQVLFQNVSIRNPKDCRIIKYSVEPGTEVEIGDSLFTFMYENPEMSPVSGYGSLDFAMKVSGAKDPTWAEKKRFELKTKVKLTYSKLKELQGQLSSYKAQLQRIKNEVILDAMPRNRYEDQLRKIQNLELEVDLAKSEIGILNQSIKDLDKFKSTAGSGEAIGSGNGGGNGGNANLKTFYSPLKGTITKIDKQPFEVALKTEQILSIHEPTHIFIKAFFEQEDLKSLKEGDIVDLEFPDGTKSQGIINRFYFATYRLPEEFQKKYEPTTRSLSADIIPVDKRDLNTWKAYYKMSVEVTKSK